MKKRISFILITVLILAQSISVFADAYTYKLVKSNVSDYIKEAQRVYPTDDYKTYETSIIGKYIIPGDSNADSPEKILIEWKNLVPNSNSYTLYLSTTESFTDKTTVVKENIKETAIELWNLYSKTTYYWKVKSGNTESTVQSFKTDDTVRYINAEGTRNVRDIGGWNGLTQGLVFRGSELNLVPGHGLEITENGRNVLKNDLKIKTDLDFRGESGLAGITSSPIGNEISWINLPIGSYMNAFAENNKNLSDSIRLFANKDNYPIYMHCWGGADRTGTVAFILEGLSGVSETDLAIDFELTSFSVFSRRYRYDDTSFKYASMLNKIKTYKGNTLQDKFKTYAKQVLGLTNSEITNIVSILTSNNEVNQVTFKKSTFSSSSDKDNVTVVLNGLIMQFPEPPQIKNGTTLVPMRAIFESLGAEVFWEDATQTVTATKGNTRIVLQIGNTTAKKNNEKIILLTPPELIGDYTMVPIRFISESLDMDVKWISETKTVIITSKQ